jgi:hypothetical protein
MGLNAYLEITNMLVGVNRSKIDSFTELCSKLERRGFEINEDTSSVTIDDVAKDNYIVYKQRISSIGDNMKEDGAIYIFDINEDYDISKVKYGSDGDAMYTYPYTLNCIEGLYFYNYSSEAYKEYDIWAKGPNPKPEQKSIFELSNEQLQNYIPNKFISEYWMEGEDDVYKIIGGTEKFNVYAFKYSEFMDAIKDLYLINWIKKNPFSLEK